MKQIVKVRFVQTNYNGGYAYSPKEYNYVFSSSPSVTLKEGGYAVIEQADGKGLAIVKITAAEQYSMERVAEIEDAIGTTVKTKPIIGTADLSEYFVEKERQERIAQINENLAVQFRKAEKMALYKKLAETDPVMKSLLDELESLGGTVDVDEITSSDC